jgi:hypothetical protein
MTMDTITLRAEITIDGVTYTYQQPISRHLWERHDERPYFENVVRENLGKNVMMQLKPPVTVHTPTDPDAGEQPPTDGTGAD